MSVLNPVECSESEPAACSLDTLSTLDLDRDTQNQLIKLKLRINASATPDRERSALREQFNRIKTDALAQLRAAITSTRSNHDRTDAMCKTRTIDVTAPDAEALARKQMILDSSNAHRAAGAMTLADLDEDEDGVTPSKPAPVADTAGKPLDERAARMALIARSRA